MIATHFFSCKKLCFHLVRSLGSRVVKKLSSSCRERLRQKPWHQGDTSSAPQRPLDLLEGGLSSVWRPTSLQRLVRWSPILMSFTSSSRKWLSWKSQRYGRLCGLNPGHADPIGLVQVLLQDHGFIALIVGYLLHVLEEGMGTVLALHIQETLGALHFFSANS